MLNKKLLRDDFDENKLDCASWSGELNRNAGEACKLARVKCQMNCVIDVLARLYKSLRGKGISLQRLDVTFKIYTDLLYVRGYIFSHHALNSHSSHKRILVNNSDHIKTPILFDAYKIFRLFL